jgi:hypothetical protein
MAGPSKHRSLTRVFGRMLTVLVAASIGIAACTLPPSIDQVRKDAQIKLQKELDGDFKGKGLSVKSIEIVHLQGPKYQGVATVRTIRSEFPVPIDIVSDGQDTLVTTDHMKLTLGLRNDFNARFNGLSEKQSDYIFNRALFDLLPTDLTHDKSDFADFKKRFEWTDKIQHEGRFYLGSGCMADDCGSDVAAWIIDSETGESAVVIKITSIDEVQAKKFMEGKAKIPPQLIGTELQETLDRVGKLDGIHTNFRIFGATAANLPEPLAQWAEHNEMDVSNIQVKTGDIWHEPVP